MAYIQDIDVTIVKGSIALAQKGFGLPLIYGNTNSKAGKYGIYTSIDAVSDGTDGYSTESDEYKMASVMFSQNPRPKEIAIYTRDIGTQTIEADLNQLNIDHPGFYAMFIPERNISSEKATIHDIADWAESHDKLFFGCASLKFDVDNTTIIDSPVVANAAAVPQTFRNGRREVYIIHNDPSTYPECAWAAQNLPKNPGSITWKWKVPTSQYPVNYNATQLQYIRNNNAQTITNIGGLNVVNEGKAASGDYIDIVRGQDWVKARLEEDLYGLFISNDKVPLDNVGIAQVEGVIRSVLKRAGNMGIIARATTEEEMQKSDDKEFMYQVTVPKREDLTTSDREHRILPNVRFTYWLAGAIHEAQVYGKIIA